LAASQAIGSTLIDVCLLVPITSSFGIYSFKSIIQ
jgi:hypothetical protein